MPARSAPAFSNHGTDFSFPGEPVRWPEYMRLHPFMANNKNVLLIALFLILATLAAFWQVGNNGFLNFDDDDYLTANRHIQNGITTEGLRWAFTTRHAANWHPLTWISHMLDIQLFGLNPRWHHLTNLLFHIANVLLLFFALNRLTKALWQSAFVAALFALHPLHVESVAWVAERKDVLSTFFWMLILLAYSYYATRARLKSYLVVVALFSLGLMAKPMLVTLPFVLLLLDYWPLERFAQKQAAPSIPAALNSPATVRKKKGKAARPTRKISGEREKPAGQRVSWAVIRPLVLEKIPLFVLTILSCAATYIAQDTGGAVASTETYTAGIRLGNAFVSYILYLAKTIWPNNLAVFYPHPGLLPLWQVLGAVLFLATVTFAVIRTSKRFPYLPVGWLWFTGTLVPVIGVVQVGGQAMADRYTYIPSIGLFIMAAWGIPEIFKKRRYWKEVLTASSALCILCLSMLTWRQVGYWHDNITISDHALSITKNNYRMYLNRGLATYLNGDFGQAVEDYNRAIEINPRYFKAYTNRGTAYYDTGNYTRAIEDFDRAIQCNPRHAMGYYNLGLAYTALGDRARAIENYGRAVAIDPNDEVAYYNRGTLYQDLGKYRQAIDDFDKAIQAGFNKAEVYCNRGAAYGYLGNHAKAIEDYNRSIEINPEYANAYFNRGVDYGEQGDHQRALQDFDRALQINPGYPEAHYFRGVVHAMLGDEDQALEDMKAAAKLGHPEAAKFLKKDGLD